MLVVVFLLLCGTTSADTISDFLALPRATSIRARLQNLTTYVHVAGTQENEDTANYVRAEFEAAGMQVEWDTFDSLVTYPLDHAVSLTFPVSYNCSLKEPNVTIDPSSFTDLPTYHGYSANGDVEAELVYVNYGLIEDFEYLENQNISVAGKIVIVRYGSNFRGTKVYLAQLRGAVGVLIYSDPQDDGQGKGPVYPEGPWRPEWGVQRGSVQFLNICPGDPRRVEECLGDSRANYSGTMIPSIPAHPLSWGDAQYLLRQLNGTIAPAGWQGGIPNLTYAIGPGPARVRLYVKQNFTVTSLINVCGTIPGTVPSEGAVILGNHRDAWNFGGADPSSGTAVMMEMTSAFGELLKKGWKPRRTIVICSWDGEEYALLGSTNWTARHQALVSGAVAYLNVDVAVSGSDFLAQASPSLTTAIDSATSRVPHPASLVAMGTPWPRKAPALGRAWPGPIGVLGSGSDYTSFLHHWGVPSGHFEFEGSYGVYHSVYDSFTWVDLFGDKNFVYSEAITKLWGTLALVLAEPERVPLSYQKTADALQGYFASVNQSADPTKLNLTGLRAAISEYSGRAGDLDAITDRTDVVNNVTHRAERNFLVPEGLPGRPYFKHVLQAPGIFLGYGSDVFPGLTEAIRAQDWPLAQKQADTLTSVLRTAAAALQVPPAGGGDKGGIDPWIVVGIVAGVLALASAVFFCYRSRKVQSKGYNPIE